MTDLRLDPQYDHPDHREMALKHLESADQQTDVRIMQHRVAEAQVFALLDVAAAYRERTELMKPPKYVTGADLNHGGDRDPADVATEVVEKMDEYDQSGDSGYGL